MAKEKSQNLNVPMILISAVIAALAWFLIHGLKALLLVWNGPLAISIISTLFLVVMSLAVTLASRMMGTYRADVVTGERKKTKFVLTMILSALACLALMFGFEWLYEADVLGGGGVTYIFVVDDSESTEKTDEEQMRYQAIQTIMQEMPGNTQYAIYSFADDVKLVQPMQKVSEGIPLIRGNSLGLTAIKTALERVISDYEQGVWEAEGGVQVILITDGYATDMDTVFEADSILERYSRNNIPVSSVGLGYVDDELLTRFANKTGGEFVDITQVDQMSEAIKSAAVVSAEERDLFSDRSESSYNFLYGIMRILFVGLLGVLISVATAFAYGNSSTFWFIVSMGAVKAFIASTLLEVGICVLGLPVDIINVVAMTLIGTVIAKYGEVRGSRSTPRGTARRIGDRSDFDD